jgi:hypothetical protein
LGKERGGRRRGRLICENSIGKRGCLIIILIKAMWKNFFSALVFGFTVTWTIPSPWFA